jgi:hypothetical protein
VTTLEIKCGLVSRIISFITFVYTFRCLVTRLTGQYALVDYELAGIFYSLQNATSTHDCFSTCIRNPACTFAIAEDKHNDVYGNCILKAKTNSTRLAFVANQTEYKAFAKMTGKSAESFSLQPHALLLGTLYPYEEYRNEVVLHNMPTHKNYTFRVIVILEGKSGMAWSNRSNESHLVSNHIGNFVYNYY